MSSYRFHERERFEQNVSKGVRLTCLGLLAGILIYCANDYKKFEKSIANYERAFTQVVSKHADGCIDGKLDGVITPKEQDALFQKIVRSNGGNALYQEGRHTKYLVAKFNDGTHIPRDTLTEWFRNYKP